MYGRLLPRATAVTFLAVACAAGFTATTTQATVYYVDADSPKDGPGNDWEHAYHYLQNALAVPSSGDEIHVAEGTHRPDETTVNPDGTSDREATFQLISGVEIYGGYAGYGQPDPDERDITLHETILSGDLAEDDGPGQWEDYGENSYHVVTGSGTDATAILDGFTITAGNANGGWGQDNGGGMFNEYGNPTVAKCSFRGNSAINLGGGMANTSGSSPILTKCTFNDNVAEGGGGGIANSWGYGTATLIYCTFLSNTALCGGGMFNYDSDAELIECTFESNVSSGCGGGIHNSGSSNPIIHMCIFRSNSTTNGGGGMINEDPETRATLTNCVFESNSAADGGGMSNQSSPSDVKVTNCLFRGNSATGVASGRGRGGGVINWFNGSDPTFFNCTFSGNYADGDGGGVANHFTGHPTLINCILWGNMAPDGPEISNIDSTATLRYCDIQGGYGDPDDHNIDADPLLVRNPDDGGDGWGDDPSTPGDDEGANDDYGDLRLQPGSPCVDAGDNTAVPPDDLDLDGDADTDEPIPFDLDGNPRFVDDPDTEDTGNPPGGAPIVDMGAYEYQPCFCGDIDHSGGLVDLYDVATFAICFGLTGPGGDCTEDNFECSDIDGDGIVDLGDFSTFALWFGLESTQLVPNCTPE